MLLDHPIAQKIRHRLLEWRAFIIINAVIPLLYVMFLKVVELQMRVQNTFTFSLVLMIFFANLWCAISWRAQRRAFVVIMLLNAVGLFVLSDVSFFTAIPFLKFLITVEIPRFLSQ